MERSIQYDMIIGPIGAIDGALGGRLPTVLRAKALEPSVEPGRNTILIDQAKMESARTIEILDGGGRVVGRFEASVGSLFRNLCAKSEERDALGLAALGVAKGEFEQYVPLFMIPSDPWAEGASLYSQLRYTETSAIFLRTCEAGDFAAAGAEAAFVEAITRAIEAHARNFVFLGNHQCYYRKMENGIESEHKLTFRSPVDPWRLCVEIYEAVKEGRLAGYILEYRDEFQKWDYMNHLYEVTGPEEEKGYVSFIPQTNGKYTIKRKIFKNDQLSRRELHSPHVPISTDIDAYVKRNYPYEVRKYPPFRRTRYDINLESLRTGNVFGIFFDRVTVAGGHASLFQCEIEYLRTRSLFENGEYRPELEAVTEWARKFLDGRSLGYDEGFYSKLSFLRDNYSATAEGGAR